jgi:hypothetical protein
MACSKREIILTGLQARQNAYGVAQVRFVSVGLGVLNIFCVDGALAMARWHQIPENLYARDFIGRLVLGEVERCMAGLELVCLHGRRDL